MATHSSILAWKIPRTEKPAVPGVAKSQTQWSMNTCMRIQPRKGHRRATRSTRVSRAVRRGLAGKWYSRVNSSQQAACPPRQGASAQGSRGSPLAASAAPVTASLLLPGKGCARIPVCGAETPSACCLEVWEAAWRPCLLRFEPQ